VAFGTWRHAALFSWRSAAHMVGEGDFMTDDRSKAGPADRSRINVHQDHEVQYWTNALGVSELELREAVKAAGPSAEKVRALLESKRQA